MSYKIKLGTFTKYVESTKQPNTATWTEYDVVFKDGTDIVNPTITLAIDYSTVSAYNYAYMLNRYYWITGKNMLRSGYCVLTLKTDVLATYKSAIGNSDLYILRSSALSDGTIVDNYYQLTGDTTYHTENKQPFYGSYSSGFYVVNVLGTATTGSTTLWKMTDSKFRSFLNNLFGNIDGFTFSDIPEALNKLIQGQPEKLISSAMWFPNGTTFITDNTATEVYVASWDSGVKANLITDPVATKTVSFDVPKHPQAASRGTYLNLAPYSIYTLTIPLFGSINLDSTALINASKINAHIEIDATTGCAWLEVYTDSAPSTVLANINGQFGVVLPISGQSSGANVAGGLTSTLAATTAAVATGGAALIAGAIGAGIGTVVGAITGATSSVSSMGNAAAIGQLWKLDSTHFAVVDEDNTRNGRPLCQVKKPSVLTGFMIASRGDVDISGTLPEEEEIKRYLESGFFYE